MELIQLGEKTYYIKNPTNIGVYRVGENEVFLIDAGNDKDAGKKILKLVEAQGWRVKGIIVTHSHADHIGGCKLIQDRTGCAVYALGIESCFTQFPILEPSFLFGAQPPRQLQNKFLMAKESAVTPIDNNLPEALTCFSLKGHCFDMIGIKTDDGVYFLADALCSEETVNKYHLFYLFDVDGYLQSLDTMAALEGKWFVPSHCEAAQDIGALIDLNRAKIGEIAEKICALCGEAITFEDILQQVFTDYDLVMNTTQYVLLGCTVRAFLSKLLGDGKVEFIFQNNKMYWKQC